MSGKSPRKPVAFIFNPDLNASSNLKLQQRIIHKQHKQYKVVFFRY